MMEGQPQDRQELFHKTVMTNDLRTGRLVVPKVSHDGRLHALILVCNTADQQYHHTLGIGDKFWQLDNCENHSPSAIAFTAPNLS